MEEDTQVMRFDLWEVTTRKRTHEGTVEAIRENVLPGHELLPQSLAPGFVKGSCTTPECAITTYLFRNMDGQRNILEMKTEFTSPEWNLWEQRQLAPYRKSTLNTATEFAKGTYTVLATQVAPETTLFLRTVRSNVVELYETVMCNYEDIRLLLWVVFFTCLIPILPTLATAYVRPDYMLDRALAINTEVVSILQNISVRDMPLKHMAEEASEADTTLQSVVLSKLPDKTSMSMGIHDERSLLNTLGKEIEDFRFQVHWLGMEIHSTHEKALFYLRRRDELSWGRWHRYAFQIRTPTLKEIRQELMDETFRLSGKLDVRIDVADSIGLHLAALAQKLEHTERQLRRSQHLQEDALRALSNATWSASWKTLRSPRKVQLHRDIETAQEARNRTLVLQELVASVPIGAVQYDLRRARASLRALVDPAPFLRLKVYLFANFTAEQQAHVGRIVELASFFDHKPPYPSNQL